jgi:hypothetical protein
VCRSRHAIRWGRPPRRIGDWLGNTCWGGWSCRYVATGHAFDSSSPSSRASRVGPSGRGVAQPLPRPVCVPERGNGDHEASERRSSRIGGFLEIPRPLQVEACLCWTGRLQDVWICFAAAASWIHGPNRLRPRARTLATRAGRLRVDTSSQPWFQDARILVQNRRSLWMCLALGLRYGTDRVVLAALKSDE